MINFKGLGIVSPPYFWCAFTRKMFLILCSISWLNFIVWLPLLFEVLGNMCIAIVCFPGCEVINFKIDLIFLWNRFSTWPQFKTKIWKSLERKEILRWNKKYLLSFLKSFQMSKIVSEFRVHLFNVNVTDWELQ